MTEYDNLDTVIVGIEYDSNYIIDETMRYSLTLKDDFPIDKHYQERNDNLKLRNEILDTLADTLTDQGVTVIRPPFKDIKAIEEKFGKEFADTQNFDSNVRDIFIVLDDMIVITPTYSIRRKGIHKIYQEIFDSYRADGYKIVYPPESTGLRDTNHYSIEDTDWMDFKNDDYAIYFESANLIKHKDVIIFNISNHNEYQGYLWFKEVVNVEVQPCFIDIGHIDGALNVVNDNLILLCFNSDFITLNDMKARLPKVLDGVEIIVIDKNPDVHTKKLDYMLASIGGMDINTLSLSENKIVISKRNPYLQKQLTDKGIEVVGVPMGNTSLFNGGIHCTTVDLLRTK